MAKKIIRAAHRSQRGCSEKHNDRNFDIEKADNIDHEKTKNNINWVWADDELSDEERSTTWSDCQTFADWERAYYDLTFSESLDMQNQKYIKQGQRGRVKTIDDIYANKNKGPEDVWIQMGKAADDIKPSEFEKCALLYFDYLREWNEQHGEPMGIMSMSIHFDEATPHMQFRRCWQYTDDVGRWHIGQDKALEQAGVELPDPTKPRSSRNNRKMTFDKHMREKWIEIVEANTDYEINKIPLPRRKHTNKVEYIQQQDQELKAIQEDLERQRIELQNKSKNVSDLELQAKKTMSEAEIKQQEADKKLKQVEDLRVKMAKDYKEIEELLKKKREIPDSPQRFIDYAKDHPFLYNKTNKQTGEKVKCEYNVYDEWTKTVGHTNEQRKQQGLEPLSIQTPTVKPRSSIDAPEY